MGQGVKAWPIGRIRIMPRPKGAEVTGMKDLNNLWEFLAYIISYRMKELVILLMAGTIAVYLFINVEYNKKDGFCWKPAPVKVEVKK